MAYDMRYLFIIPMLVYEYAGAVDDCWGNRASAGVYLLSHWSKVSLHVVAQFQRDSCKNWSEDKDIISCEWPKELFVNYSYPALIKMVEDKYEALEGIEQGRITYLNISLDEMFITSGVVITSLHLFFTNFAWDSVAKYPS